MTTNDDLVPVSQFITENERNIEIATAIFEQYEAARAKMVAEFLDRLTIDLKAKLPGWTFQYGDPFFTSDYGHFWLNKPAWSGCYAILLEAFERGTRMVYGVFRDEDLIGSVQRNAELLAAVRKKLPHATSRKWYEAEIRMSSPASDWRIPKVLWRMHSDDTFRAEVVALLLEIVALTEERVDAMVKALPKSIKRLR